MVVRHYVFDELGPCNWQRSKEEGGSEWYRSYYFEEDGYATELEALQAIDSCLKDQTGGTFFVMKGYSGT